MNNPVTINDASLRAPLVSWQEWYADRDFLFLLVWREVHMRYRHTLIGIGWGFLNPLMTMAVFGLIVPNLMSRQTLAAYTRGVPYPIYVLCGLAPWNCFTHALTRSATCMVDQSALIKNIYFPRLFFPLSKALAALVDLGLSLAVLLLLMVCLRVAPSGKVIFLPLLMVPLLASALGAGLFLSVLQLRFRDVLFLMQFFLQLGLFVTPVWFPLEALPGPLRWAVACNPMTAVVQGFRWAVFNAPPPAPGVAALSTAMSILTMLAGLAFFRKRQETVADYV